MTSIDDLIKREVNPFDLINLKPGNFWGEQQDLAQMVESIHEEEVTEIESLLDLVATDHRSRTVLLVGDMGSGKSYLLGRLKRTLNPKAFFAYIGSWFDSDRIWRHILQYTVDSLMQVPEGQQDSQLILWLKSLSVFTKRSPKQRIFNNGFWELLQSDRQKFIKHLKDTYKTAGIYSSDIFFSVLHDLTDPELYPLACEWLRGDDLSEESMQALKVKHCVDTEDAAKNLLANIGRIATETQPIVLCFDSLDNIARLPDGSQDFQALFNVNTTVHNDYLKNFLVIISVITDTWKRNSDRIQQADKVRIDREVQLKRITLEQAEALWAYRLNPLHQQANPQPNSPIFPLKREALEQNYLGGKTTPRSATVLGRLEYQRYKNTLGKDIPETDTTQAEFQLLWQQEYNKNQGNITKISLLAAAELIGILQEVLAALKVQEIKPKLITGKYASYSLSYQQSGKRERVGVVWTEEPNMNSFFHVMNACQKVIQQNLCQTLYLIRAGELGTPNLIGNQIYRQIFTHTNHHHIKPTLSSVHYLATYHNLVNSALAHELVVAGKTITLEELEALIRNSKILQDCLLLQDLGIVSGGGTEPEPNKLGLRSVKDYLLNLVITQGFMGRPTLIKNTNSQFSNLNTSDIEQLINQLCQENKIEIFNPKAKPEEQTVCLVVKK